MIAFTSSSPPHNSIFFSQAIAHDPKTAQASKSETWKLNIKSGDKRTKSNRIMLRDQNKIDYQSANIPDTFGVILQSHAFAKTKNVSVTPCTTDVKHCATSIRNLRQQLEAVIGHAR